MAKKQTKKTSNANKVGIGVGLTAAAVAAAGAYFLMGSPNAANNRKKVKSWMLKAKAEVLEALENAEKMTAEEFDDLVDVIAKTYSTVQGATKGEIADFRKEMKDHWTKLEKTMAKKSSPKKAAKKTAKKVAKKTVKKTAKKAPKKTTATKKSK